MIDAEEMIREIIICLSGNEISMDTAKKQIREIEEEINDGIFMTEGDIRTQMEEIKQEFKNKNG